MRWFILLLFLISACYYPLRQISNGKVRSGETIVVGKVEIIPPIGPYEQQGLGTYRGKVFLISQDPNYSYLDEEYHVGVHFERTFALKTNLKKIYIKKAYAVMDFGGKPIGYNNAKTYQINEYYPGSLEIELPETERAVYIGTIQYYRNEKGGYQVLVKDDYEQANAEFKKYFSGIPLGKSLARPTATIPVPAKSP
jgi:hypothetical protein